MGREIERKFLLADDMVNQHTEPIILAPYDDNFMLLVFPTGMS